jgi:hypothetical protein
MKEVQTMKLKKNLGSNIEAVKNFSEFGYTIKYNNGDVCNLTSGETYSSEVKYICS